MKNRLHCYLCKGLLSFLLCFGFFTKTFAQHIILGNENFKVEAGLNFGPTFFLGDLGGHHGYGTTFIKDLNLPVTKLMKGAFITAYPNDWLGLRVAAEYTYLEGRDNLITTNGVNELYRKQRNLDFKSDIWEAYGAVEFFPMMLLHNDEEIEYAPKLRPYVFAGLGVYHFDPMGSLTKNNVTTWYHLRDYHTEGEGFAEYPDRKVYNLTQMNLPMGGGLKYFTSERVNICLEVLYRKTFTDYIDDVSTDYINPELFSKYMSPEKAAIARQLFDKTYGVLVPGASRYAPGDTRGNPKNTDAYFSFLLKFGVRIGPMFDDDFTAKERKQTRCPARF